MIVGGGVVGERDDCENEAHRECGRSIVIWLTVPHLWPPFDATARLIAWSVRRRERP